jgi:AcrR family transcriptional regulator
MNRDMSQTELRAGQIDLTRRRIGIAVAELLAEAGPAALSVPAVAERAGMSVRTVYRHYANKEALVDAAVHMGSETLHATYPRGARNLSNLRSIISVLWPELAENRDMVTVFRATPAGVAARRVRLEHRLVEITEVLDDELPDLPADDKRRLAALLTVLLGSSLMLDLTEGLGLDMEEAIRCGGFAMEAAVAAAREQGAVG